jgi:hypothetical protein
MTDQTQTPEQPDPNAVPLPIVLTKGEVQALLNALRKFPMEQVEGLVFKIHAQANQALAAIQNTQTEGETK